MSCRTTLSWCRAGYSCRRGRPRCVAPWSLSLLLAILVGGSCSTLQRADVATSLRAEAVLLTTAAGAAGNRATVAWDVAMNALENAGAARDAVEAPFLQSLREGEIQTLRTDLTEVQDAQRAFWRAQTRAAELVRHAALARDAARSAFSVAETIGEIEALEDLQGALRNIRGVAATAEEESARAAKLAETLKTDWLLPDSGTDRVPDRDAE